MRTLSRLPFSPTSDEVGSVFSQQVHACGAAVNMQLILSWSLELTRARYTGPEEVVCCRPRLLRHTYAQTKGQGGPVPRLGATELCQ